MENTVVFLLAKQETRVSRYSTTGGNMLCRVFDLHIRPVRRRNVLVMHSTTASSRRQIMQF